MAAERLKSIRWTLRAPPLVPLFRGVRGALDIPGDHEALVVQPFQGALVHRSDFCWCRSFVLQSKRICWSVAVFLELRRHCLFWRSISGSSWVPFLFWGVEWLNIRRAKLCEINLFIKHLKWLGIFKRKGEVLEVSIWSAMKLVLFKVSRLIGWGRKATCTLDWKYHWDLLKDERKTVKGWLQMWKCVLFYSIALIKITALFLNEVSTRNCCRMTEMLNEEFNGFLLCSNMFRFNFFQSFLFVQ